MRGVGRRTVLLYVALGATLALAGCGGEKKSDLDAEALLDRAFETPVQTARASIALELALEGVPEVPEPVTITLDGPYDATDTTRVPKLEWDSRIDLGGFGVGGALVSSGDNVFVRALGTTYEFGPGPVGQLNKRIGISTREAGGRPRPLAALGLHPREWITESDYAGDAEVEGVETHRIEARIALPRLDPGELEVWVGAEDGIVRKLRLDIDTGVPFELRDQLFGATHIDGSLEVVLAEVGAPQTIAAPPGPYAPISVLRERISSLAGVSG